MPGPQEILDGANQEIQEALTEPQEYDFRQKEPTEDEEINVTPDHHGMRAATVDLANDNIHLRYNVQSNREKYVAVMAEQDFSLIESTAVYNINNRSGTSTMYYLVTDDETFLHDNSWETTFNTRPREVAEEAPEIYRQALEGEGVDEDEISWGNDTEDHSPDPVPPPENDEMFPE